MELMANSKAQQAQDAVEKASLFSVENFISLYNSGMLNKSAEQIENMAVLVSEGYKNIDFRNRSLVVISSEEVTATEAIGKLEAWLPILKLMRETKDHLNKVKEDFTVVFEKSNPSWPMEEVLMEQDNGETLEQLVGYSSEKIFSKSDPVDEIFDEVGLEYDRRENGDLEVVASDITNLDTSFLNGLSQVL